MPTKEKIFSLKLPVYNNVGNDTQIHLINLNTVEDILYTSTNGGTLTMRFTSGKIANFTNITADKEVEKSVNDMMEALTGKRNKKMLSADKTANFGVLW